jgi:iron(III) transport system permease protein
VSRLSGKGSKYATMTGKGFRPRQIDLGGWRWVTAAGFMVYFVLIVILPFLVLLCVVFSAVLYRAVARGAAEPDARSLRFIFSYPDLASTVGNSLLLSFGSATSSCW